MIAHRDIRFYHSVAILIVLYIGLLAVCSAGAVAGDGNSGGDSDGSEADVTFPPSTSRGRGHVTAPPRLQIAVHNALSVAVNGHEFTDSGDEQQPLGQRATRPYYPRRMDGDENADEGSADAGGRPLLAGPENANRAYEEALRRLVSSTVGSALGAQQPTVAPATPAYLSQLLPSALLRAAPNAASVPLTLVDEHNRVIAHGVFQQRDDTALPGPTMQPALSTLVGGAVGLAGAGGTEQAAFNQLVDVLTARLTQRMSGFAGSGGGVVQAAVDSGNAALGRGVEIALTDNAGNVVGAGTYFPHNPSRAEQQAALIAPQKTDTYQPSSTATATQTPQQPASSPPSAPTRLVRTKPDSRPPTMLPDCYDNVYDSVYCQHTPRSSKPSLSRLRRLSDTQFLPATAPVLTSDEEAVIERSRRPYPAPRLAVLEPQHTTLYADSDITESLAPSLAVFPPVAPFMARPRSAAAEVKKEAVEAAEAAAPAEAAAGGTVGESAAAIVEEVPAATEALGTEFRDQA